MTKSLYVLFESAVGISLFDTTQEGSVVQDDRDILDFDRFSKIMNLTAFTPFKLPEDALAYIIEISQGILSKETVEFLTLNLPKVKEGKPAKFQLAIADPKLGAAIQDTMNLTCICDDHTQELYRGIRLHYAKFMKITPLDVEKAELALAHAYSRSAVKYDVNRTDNMVKQAVFLFDQLDKDINKLAMRSREWFGGHFPELSKIVEDNILFAHLVIAIKSRSTLTDESVEMLSEITKDAAMAKEIINASKISMGYDLSDIDCKNVEQFARRVVALADYRESLRTYLTNKMESVAPNLTAVIGVLVAARLVSHAGSLTNLSKFPASTIQILGAEKALFRALKTRKNTPKYGLIFHSSFVGKAGAKNKGRISRFLANKCALACRIDSFAEEPTPAFGEMMHDQVEERLKFYDSGVKPRKNLDVMREAAKKSVEQLTKKHEAAALVAPVVAADVAAEVPVAVVADVTAPAPTAPEDKKHKHKHHKHAADETAEQLTETVAAEAVVAPVEEKKSKKNKKARMEVEAQ
nr:nucleolar protein 56 [Paratrimastix eleionoma]